MRAWASEPVPSLAARGLGTGLALSVHNTATGQLARIEAAHKAGVYVCGITPYDATHLGHAATMLAFDLVQRVWLDAGLSVTYTQNVTDIDDPLLERAERDGVDWQDLAQREVQLFRGDMEALRMLAPQHFTGVVESMDLVVAAIERLRAAGVTYEVDGDLYFDSSRDESFGRVSRLDRETMLGLFGERGGDPERSGKRDPLDWLLWRAERTGEPAWDSPLGAGRPGWHVECAAMAVEHLGMGFEIQGGGSDLVFPHHEMSAAEAEMAFASAPFAQAYVHAGMVGLDGDKMSKSRGNLVLVSELLMAGVDPMALRLALLSHHYRTDWSWTVADLGAARTRLAAWRSALSASGPADQPGAEATAVVEAIRRALAEDLNAPAAVLAVDEWAAAAQQGWVGGGRTVAAAVDALLGVAL
ncbi:MAG: cysteine--1-D-myo-inosityl 2-amino-2-deoxy-alpha-D-glucopyranoside ligase [Nocardioidaceae bacterium]|nr:cysteine--1-D-myo-inosityl 2-amino-2-deoxy-alpha-D-glucopyranoside ligase [Nocardioidaceae bacterium]